MELVRNKHFQAYIEKIYIGCMQRHKGIEASRAKIMFQDEFLNDANMMVYVLNSTFPNTKRVNEEYHFITKDSFVHTDIESHTTWTPGAMTLRIDENWMPRMSFDNPNFHHGQIRTDGHIKCWGNFIPFQQAFPDIGLSGALMDMYNFSRVSNHDTRMESGV